MFEKNQRVYVAGVISEVFEDHYEIEFRAAGEDVGDVYAAGGNAYIKMPFGELSYPSIIDRTRLSEIRMKELQKIFLLEREQESTDVLP